MSTQKTTYVLWTGIAIAIIAGVLAYVVFFNTGTPTAHVPVTVPTDAPRISMSDVQIHNSRNDCWVIVNSNVYDVTTFISEHPGGEQEIISSCGSDATAKFMGEHEHAEIDAENQLLAFFVGVVSE